MVKFCLSYNCCFYCDSLNELAVNFWILLFFYEIDEQPIFYVTKAYKPSWVM